MKKLYFISLILIQSGLSFAQFNTGNFEMRLTEPGGEDGLFRVQARAIGWAVPTTNDFCADLGFAIWWDNVAHPGIVDIDCNQATSFLGQMNEQSPAPGSSQGQSGPIDGMVAAVTLQIPDFYPADWVLNEWVTIANISICASNNCSPAGAPPGISAEDFLLQGFTGTLPNIDINGESYTPGAAPLPLTLVDFKAKKSGERSSLLSWTTVSEVNTSHFAVQRSFDKRSWSTVGKVQAAGNSQLVENYNFVDENVYNGLDNRLTAYYRLRMVDLDGQFKNSPIKSVVFGSDAIAKSFESSIYPNPASDGVYVDWSADNIDQPTLIELYDVTGKLLIQQKVAPESNQEYLDFTPVKIQPGLYMIRLVNGTEALTQQQIVVAQSR